MLTGSLECDIKQKNKHTSKNSPTDWEGVQPLAIN